MVFVPGSLFFTHVMEWPQGLVGADLTAFVALGLEEVSPFALDSLAWGFCCDEASRTLFLYAACLPRIGTGEQEQWPLADHVYPAFMPLLVKREQAPEAPAHARRELLQTPGEIVLLEYAAGSRWPHRLDAAPVDAQGPHSKVLAAAGRLLARSPFTAASAPAAALPSTGAQANAATGSPLGEVPMWRLLAAERNRRGEVRFTLEQPDTAESASADAKPALLHSVLTGEEALWQADLRDEGFIALARKRRILDLRLWYALCAAAAAAVLLVVLWLAFVWLGSVLEARTTTLAAQGPAVERVRQDQDLLMRMRQFSADPFEPFSLIGALKSTKPETIYFDSIELSAPDSVSVEGQGPTVDSVNAYARGLELSGAYRAARQARMNLKDGASVFTLYLQYLGQPADEPPPVQPLARLRRSTAEPSAAARTAADTPPPGTTEAEWEADLAAASAQAALPEAGGVVVVGVPYAGESPDATAAGATEHRIDADETLDTIAARYGVLISAILEANPELNPLEMQAGQTIVIPALAQPLPEN